MLLHERIRAARAEQRITQDTLARRVGVSPRTPNRWETGKSKPRLSQIHALAAALGKPVEYFEDEDPAEAAMARMRKEAATDVLDAVMATVMSGLSHAKEDALRTWDGVDRRKHLQHEHGTA